MDVNNLQDIGNDILNSVSNAVSTGDYSHLSDTIKTSINGLNSEQVNKTQSRAGRNPSGQRVASYNETLKGRSAAWKKPENLNAGQRQGGTYATASSSAMRTKRSLPPTPYYQQGIVFNPDGVRVGGVFAGLGCAMFAGMSLVGITLFNLIIPGVMAVNPVSVFGLATAGVFGFVAYRCSKKSSLYKRYAAYGNAIADAEYISLEDLEKLTGYGKNTVIKDIEECKKAGYLPNARFDTKKTTLILTESAYGHYMAAEQSRVKREQDERELADKVKQSAYSAQVEQILKDGDEYLKTVRDLNDRIKDEEMSAKISRIENLMNKTFEEVRRQPDAAPSLRKYMSYYLPTTVKLLNAYAELEERPEIGENISQTKKEISDSLDLVGDAFEKLFDSLFEEMSMDVSSDISVMKTMLAQDGLTEDELTLKADENK